MLDPGVIALAIIVALVTLFIGAAVRRAQRAELKGRSTDDQPRLSRRDEAAQRQLERGKAKARRDEKEVTQDSEETAEPDEESEVVELEADEPPEDERGEPARKAAFKAGLAKTRGSFIARLGNLLTGKKVIDAETLERLEEVLVTADIGVKTSHKIFDTVKKHLSRDELADPEAIWADIRARSQQILDVGAPPLDLERARPLVLLVIGVNGVGKTTTIGKLAAKYTAAGKKVLLAAGDTFRAAATEQLEIWGQRTGCPVLKGKEGSDPSSVIFDAVKRAQAEGFDLIIGDTAGRLHTKTNLMEELQKVRRVTAKAMEGAPHETFLVLDATTGQNAIQQAQLFQQAMAITGIVLTKLDGTAKGGVILGICDELKVPVRYIGIGEKVDDLRDFDTADFVAALYDHADETAAA